MPGASARRVRFPIAATIAMVASIAVEMTSLRVASDGFVGLSRHLTVAMLAAATYLARHRDGDRAAWWFGFALVGWSYVEPAIVSSARRDAKSFVSLRAGPPVMLLGLFTSDEAPTGNNPRLISHWRNRFEILQSMFALFVVVLGGFSCWIRSRRRGAVLRREESRSVRRELADQDG